MACRCVKYSLRKQERAGRLSARLNDCAVKTLRVNHSAIRDREYERDSFQSFFVHIELCGFQRLKTCCCSEARNHAGTAQTRMRRQTGQGGFRYPECGVRLLAKLLGNFLSACLLAA